MYLGDIQVLHNALDGEVYGSGSVNVTNLSNIRFWHYQEVRDILSNLL